MSRLRKFQQNALDYLVYVIVRCGICGLQFTSLEAAEGYSRCVMEIEEMGGACKLTISHSIEKDHSKFVEAVSGGWPRILSNLKSLLETGAVALPDTA